jgi:hypothetical protein
MKANSWYVCQGSIIQRTVSQVGEDPVRAMADVGGDDVAALSSSAPSSVKRSLMSL